MELYQYNSHQLLLNSNRITLNSKRNDIYISSGRHIHIGARGTINITTANDIVYNARYTFLGNSSKTHFRNQLLPDSAGNKNKTMPLAEPMVLGQTLFEALNELVDCLSAACFMSPGGAPLPLIDKMMVPVASADNPGLPTGGIDPLTKTPIYRKSLSSIKLKLEGIKSKFHFIENNINASGAVPDGSVAEETTGPNNIHNI